MENQNTNITQGADQEQALRAYLAEQRKKRNKRIVIALVALFTVALGYFGWKNAGLLRAAITESGASGTGTLFIPNYTASPGDDGLISLKARRDAGEINSVQFTLRYTPVNALVFNENSIVFDQTTKFRSADLENVNTSVPGQVSISFFSAQAVAVLANDTLAKFAVRINSALPAGTVINLRAADVDVIIPDPTETYASSSILNSIDTGTITLGAQNDLRLLYAESLDSRHALLHFSDLLTNVGASTAYTIQPTLYVTNIERGDAQGYGQDTVFLTTSQQTSGRSYRVSASGADLMSNTKGGISPNYNQALFFGPGSPVSAISDFNVLSARATAPRNIEVIFSHPVATASVTEVDFSLSNISPAAPLPVTVLDAVTNGSIVQITTQEVLLKRNAYLISVVSPEGANAPLRASDGAHLGIGQTVFSGFTNGPQVKSAQIIDNTTLQITFDSPVTAGPQGALGTIHITGADIPDDGEVVVDADSDNVTLAGDTITIADFDSDPDVNYTFVANTGITANGVRLDSANNSVTFWGAGHDDTQNTIGQASILRRNVIEVQPGTLNFSALRPSDVRLFVYPNPVDINAAQTTITYLPHSFSLDNGRLRVTANSDFDMSSHYILQFTSTDSDGITRTVRTAEAVAAQDFAVTGAQATGASEVTVSFSENVDSVTIAMGQFVFTRNVSSTGTSVSSDFKSVRVTLNNPMVAGRVYQVRVNGVRSFAGGKLPVINTAVFAGYQTLTSVGAARVEQVRSVSSTQLEVTFSADLAPATVTPVNMQILFGNELNETLTITQITPSNTRTFRLTTNAQSQDRNYFVVPMNSAQTSGIKDSQGKFLNTQRVLNVFGFTVPAITVSAFTPSTLVNDEERIVVASGQNLQNVVTARVGTAQAVITEQPTHGLALSFRLPKDFVAGSYAVTLTDSAGTTQTYNNAILVQTPEQPLRVVSEASLATPFRVPNDNKTATTLRVLVEDPLDLAHVESVTIDLTLIGGAPSQEMTRAAGVQPQHGQWYSYATTIPSTVTTSATPIQLPVQARKGNETAIGFASVHVTRDVAVSVAPTIDQAYFLPGSAPPDATTEVKISAQVSDSDGADTITSVVANLGPVGVGFVPLTAVSGIGSASETVSQFFESAAFKIPTTTPTATYQIVLTAQDATGETASKQIPFNISSQLSGPNIDKDQSYIAPRNSVPNDGKTPFSINVFVRDPDGLKDITSVIANFGAIGLPPTQLTRATGTPDTAKSGYYAANSLTIPTTISNGVRQIVVTATDSAGSTATLALQIDVTEEDTLGEPPRILTDRAYITPRVAVNDGSTPFTLHVFVRDDDNDIDTVLVNLGNVAQAGTEQPDDFAVAPAAVSSSSSAPADASSAAAPAVSATPCSATSRTLLCLEPSVREGMEGQWFISPDLTISSNVPPSPQPYFVEVVATDQTGKTTHQSIPILVASGEQLSQASAPVSIVTAVATSQSSVELVFSRELDLTSVSGSGSAFNITNSDDIKDGLAILGATINASGTIVTLTTDPQVPGKEYVLTAGTELRDATGMNLMGGAAARTLFNGFALSDKPPVVEYIAASGPTAIELEFRDPVQPTSLKVNRIEIKEIGGASLELKIESVRFTESANSVEVKTATQKPNQRYRVTLKDVTSASGVPSAVTINKLIKGFKGSEVSGQALKASADLNQDGRVDFIDFTMFSAVYGTSVGQAKAEEQPKAEAPSNAQPIPPSPDATVPITSSTD